MLLHLLDIPALACDNSGLRASQQLITAKQYHIDTGRERCRNIRFIQPILGQVNHQTVTHIEDDRQVVILTDVHQLIEFNLFSEPHNLVIAGVHLHKRAGVLVNRLLIVARLGLVGSSNLVQSCAALHHNVRNSKGSSYFNQLTTRYNYLMSLSHR